MNIAEIVAALEKCNYAISEESRLARVGLKDKQEIAPIVEKYKWLHDGATVGFVKAKYETEADPAAKEELRLLFFELAGMYLYAKVATEADELTTYFVRAVAEVGKEKIPFYNLAPRLMKSADFAERERLQDAMFPIVAAANAKELDILERQVGAMQKELGYRGYIDYYQHQKRLDYRQFAKLVESTYQAVRELYEAKMAPWVERELQRPFGDLRNCHASYLLQQNHFDQYFPAEKLRPAFESTLANLGLPLDKLPNIHIDTEDRPKKNPRAVCYSPNVPSEIHLIIKMNGGHHDYESFFHEGGHALHFAHVDPALSYVFRNLSSSHAYTELFSFTFESLTRSATWLTRYLDIPEEIAAQIEYESELADLLMLVRYLAKFTYEYQFFSASAPDASGALYADKLSSFTKFIYNPVMSLHDMDGGFYSADYLRAWIARAELSGYLNQSFGENWFNDPKAGEFLKAMWRGGFQHELEDQIRQHTGAKAFDTAPLIQGYKDVLSRA